MQYSYNPFELVQQKQAVTQSKNVLIQSVGMGERGIPFSPLLTASAGFCVVKCSFSYLSSLICELSTAND